MGHTSINLRILSASAAVGLAGLGLAPAAIAQTAGDERIDVYGQPGVEGPDVDGILISRTADSIEVAQENGQRVRIDITPNTEVRAKGGFLGLGRTTLDASALLNGLPVSVETLQFGDQLVAESVRFSKDDYETAAMIRNGTAQQFAAQRADIDSNTAAAEALRGRMGDIDKYDIRGTTNVFFDTGKWNLSTDAQRELCSAAQQADSTENALLLVVGYTDSVGSQDYNQVLSERRASRVVNFLQQECGWKPWRMLTPTGFAEADPLADNTTAEGRRQNRRVSVNILVNKASQEGG